MNDDVQVPDDSSRAATNQYSAGTPAGSGEAVSVAGDLLLEDNRDAKLSELTAAVQGLRDDFRHSMQVNDRNRTLIDKLHHENEQLRRAELERTRDPVIRDLISLADTCLRNGRAWLKHDTVTPAEVDRILRDVSGDVQQILERQGVESFEFEAGTAFDRRLARAVRSADTTDASLDGTVATVLKPGYRVGSRVLRYCDVVVWAFDSATARDTLTGH